MTTQSKVYDLCKRCGHFRHLHGKIGDKELCHGSRMCNCTQFEEMKPVVSDPDKCVGDSEHLDNIPQQVEDYRQYLQIIKGVIENEIPQVRQIDRGYAETVARNVISVLDKEGWCITRKLVDPLLKSTSVEEVIKEK